MCFRRRALAFLQALATLLLGLAAAASLPAPAAAGAVVGAAWWKPARYMARGNLTTFQYQLSAKNDIITIVPGVKVYAIDIDVAAAQIPRLKKYDRSTRVICYVSVGTWEEERVEYDRVRRGILPDSWKNAGAVGNKMDDWPKERWLDVRNAVVRGNMLKRLRYARKVGCDGVDPDNVNAHATEGTGFPGIRAADLVAYLKFLAAKAHGLGMGIGLKNAMDLLPSVEPVMDWFINEECFTWDECDPYKKVGKGKPVWGVEYCDAWTKFEVGTLSPACFCPRALAWGFSFSYKRVDLDASGISCTSYCKKVGCKPAVVAPECVGAKRNRCWVLPAAPALG